MKEDGVSRHIISALLTRWAEWCKGEAPTRAIFLLPEPDQRSGREFIDEAEALGGYKFLTRSFGFTSPETFKYEQVSPPGPYSGKVHFVLFQSAAAAVLDPVSPAVGPH